MKALIFCLGLFFLMALHGQKETITKKVDTKAVNEKLVKLQASIKKLETTLSEAVKQFDKIRDTKESLSELSKEDMKWIQLLMEKKSQLEQMISNVMKAASETQNNISRDLIAS